MLKNLRYFFEGCFLYILYMFFSLCSARTASNIGGWTGKTIGSRLAASRKALRNIEQAFPGKTPEEHQGILKDMWENLGRTFAEYPHLKELGEKHTCIEGIDIITTAQAREIPLIMISAHLANWEILGAALYLQYGLKGPLLYRTPNNPYADKLLRNARSLNGILPFVPKSGKGLRRVLRLLSQKGSIGLLIDQKFNKGIPVEFFGRLAMTSPAFVEWAQKYDARIIPVQIKREAATEFRMIIHPPLATGNKEVAEVVRQSHIMLEEWIRETPGQWLWLHRRWDSKQLKDLEEQDGNI